VVVQRMGCGPETRQIADLHGPRDRSHSRGPRALERRARTAAPVNPRYRVWSWCGPRQLKMWRFLSLRYDSSMITARVFAALSFVLTPVTLQRKIRSARSARSPATRRSTPRCRARAGGTGRVCGTGSRSTPRQHRAARIAASDYATRSSCSRSCDAARRQPRPPSPWSMVAYEIFAAAKTNRGRCAAARLGAPQRLP
jgi:hypothetical protein